MTKQEELERAIEDRDMLENDIELMNQEIIALEKEDDFEESQEWEYLNSEVNTMDNEVMYLNHVIESLVEELS